jgi:hypothetical protein
MFLFGWDATTSGGAGGGGDAGRFARVAKLQGGTFQTVWTSTTHQGFDTTSGSGSVNGHAAMFTDPSTGNLIVFIHGANTAGASDIQVVSIANANIVPIATDITTTVLGPGPNPTSGDGAEKYRVAVGPFADWRRRWSVFVDSSDPSDPHTFLTTWSLGSGGDTETWEWLGIDTDLDPVVTTTGGQEGISNDFALPYVTTSGGERSPRTGSVEFEGVPERAVGGTKFEFRGHRTAAGIVEFYGDNGLGAGTPAVQLPIVSGSLVVGAGMFTNLEAYYQLEGTGNRVDSSGNGLSLTQNGTVSASSSGIIGNGADFDGNNANYLSRAKTTSLEIGENLAPYALSCWVDINTASLMGICAQGNSTTDGWWLDINSNGAVRFIQVGTVTINSPDAAITPTAGLQHIVLTSDGNTTKIYVDSVEMASEASITTLNTASAFTVGNRTITKDRPFDGVIDELAVWSRYLTPAEVSALYNSGSGKLLTEVTGLPTTPSISGNTIVDFTCDNGATLYSVILDASNAGITPGAPGTIMADLTQLG